MPINRHSNSYPDVRYFLAKKNNAEQINKSHLRGDISGTQKQINGYSESNCDKWEEIVIDYTQGYNHSSAQFPQLFEGTYALFIHTTHVGEFKIRFDSSTHFKEQPHVFDFDEDTCKEIFDSVFFSIGLDNGVNTSFTK